MKEPRRLDDHLSVVDELRVRPFGDPWTGDDGFNAGGPDFHVATLRVSRSWLPHRGDDDAYIATNEEFERELDQLVHALTARWGEPEVVDVLFSFYYEKYVDGAPMPALCHHLCETGLVGELHGWRVDQRWVGVSLGHPDEDAPFVLLAAIADAPPAA